MQGISEFGIKRERLLTAELGVEISSGVQMKTAGFAQRVRRRGARTGWLDLVSSGGGPAFAAIYRRFS